MSVALVSLCLKDRKRWGRSHPIFEAYAAIHGMDFIPITERRIRLNPRLLRPRLSLHLEKLQIRDILQDYDRVVYIDADVLIHPEAPSLSELVPEDHFGCVREDIGPLAWKRHEEIAAAAKKLGSIEGWSEGYFNAGVMVISKSQGDAFQATRQSIPHCRWPDQTYINHRVRQLGHRIHWLGPEYNLIPEFGEPFANPSSRRNARLIHYAGREGKPLWDQDLSYFLKAWSC